MNTPEFFNDAGGPLDTRDYESTSLGSYFTDDSLFKAAVTKITGGLADLPCPPEMANVCLDRTKLWYCAKLGISRTVTLAVTNSATEYALPGDIYRVTDVVVTEYAYTLGDSQIIDPLSLNYSITQAIRDDGGLVNSRTNLFPHGKLVQEMVGYHDFKRTLGINVQWRQRQDRRGQTIVEIHQTQNSATAYVTGLTSQFETSDLKLPGEVLLFQDYLRAEIMETLGSAYMLIGNGRIKLGNSEIELGAQELIDKAQELKEQLEEKAETWRDGGGEGSAAMAKI